MFDLGKINCFDDIQNLAVKKSTPDGESSTLEFKGTGGRNDIFNQEDKKNLSKEIVAFANTYGGLVVFHDGKNTQIEKFNSDRINEIFGKIENWVSDGVQPPIPGINLKKVEGCILIDVPESTMKPHRSGPLNQYFFRSGSNSKVMNELMISSLYRSQDRLGVEPKISLEFTNQVRISFSLKNQSNLVGTKPKVTIGLWGDKTENTLAKMACEGYISEGRVLSFENCWEKLSILGVVSSDREFREEILYPRDEISDTLYFVRKKLPLDSDPQLEFWANEFFLISLSVNFLECPKIEHFALLKVEKTKGQLRMICEGSLSHIQKKLDSTFGERLMNPSKTETAIVKLISNTKTGQLTKNK